MVWPLSDSLHLQRSKRSWMFHVGGAKQTVAPQLLRYSTTTVVDCERAHGPGLELCNKAVLCGDNYSPSTRREEHIKGLQHNTNASILPACTTCTLSLSLCPLQTTQTPRTCLRQAPTEPWPCRHRRSQPLVRTYPGGTLGGMSPAPRSPHRWHTHSLLLTLSLTHFVHVEKGKTKRTLFPLQFRSCASVIWLPYPLAPHNG